jgi:YD repeat-containing protein
MRNAQGWRGLGTRTGGLFFLSIAHSVRTPSPSRKWRALRHWFALLLVMAAGAAAAADVQYVYDGAGRLVQITAADGSSALYRYDSAGNIVAIERISASTVSVSALTPGSGAQGTVVTISGSGFSVTPAQNSVSFNGVNATVSAATASTLVVVVPSGATTGSVTVTSPGGSANSPRPFIITSTLAISGFTPTTGTTGTAVTITGTGFNTTTIGNTVLFNTTKALVSAASATQLDVVVPSNAASGRITVATDKGKAVSSSDFIIPPASYATTDIVATGRVPIGSTGAAVSISTANKVGVYLFDGMQGQSFSLLFTGVTLTGGTFAIYQPNGTVFFSGNIAENALFDLPVLPVTGTYSIAVIAGTTTGSATIKLLPLSSPVLKTDGTVTAFSLGSGQNAAPTFQGTAGQFYSLVLTNFSAVPSSGSLVASIVKPDGSTLKNCGTFTASAGNCDFGPLPSSGVYTIRINPGGTAAISFNVVVSTDLLASLTVGAPSTTFSTNIPGQNIRYTFAGAAGQNLTAVYTNNTIAKGTIFLLKPDGTILETTNYSGSTGGTLDATLPTAGTYTAVVYVDRGSTGQMNFAIVAEQSGTTNTNGTPTSVALAAGQNAVLTFSGSAGQFHSLVLTNFSSVPSGGTLTATVLKPDGSTLKDCGTYSASSGNCDFGALPSTGTYKVRLDPAGVSAISFNVLISTDLTGSIAVNAAPVTFSTNIPGQNIRYSFTGSAGQNVTLFYTNDTIPRGTFFFFKPDGTALVWKNNYAAAASGFLDATLPSAGTYEAVVYVDGGSTGQVDVQLYSDAGGSVSTDGTPFPLTLSAGQNGTLTFSGTVAQGYSLSLPGLATTPSGGTVTVSFKKPDGSTFTSTYGCPGPFTASSGNCDISPLPVSGTYTVRIDPQDLVAASMNVVVSQNVAGGTLVVDGSSLTYNSSIPGQNAVYTLNGTAGQTLSLVFSSNTIPTGTLFVFRPDGTTLASRNIHSTASGTLSIPALPSTATYQIILFTDGSSVGSVTLKLETR